MTVIALCYNHERFVHECLDSIRLQTYRPIELIVVDDHSTDQSGLRIREWIAATGMPCEFIAHTKNRGICRSLNDALRRATGDYVAMVATDDMWRPEKLEHHVRHLEGLAADVGVLYGDAVRVDEAGCALPRMFIEYYRQFANPPEGDIFRVLLRGNFIPAMTTLIRRSCFERVGLYDERLAYEDWDMWLRLARRYRFAFCPLVSARYRVLPTSLVHSLQSDRQLDMQASQMLIRAKVLDELHASARESDAPSEWAHNLVGDAEALYRLGWRRSARCIWVALVREPRGLGRIRRRTVAMWLCSLLGLSYATFSMLERVASWWKRPA